MPRNHRDEVTPENHAADVVLQRGKFNGLAGKGTLQDGHYTGRLHLCVMQYGIVGRQLVYRDSPFARIGQVGNQHAAPGIKRYGH